MNHTQAVRRVRPESTRVSADLTVTTKRARHAAPSSSAGTNSCCHGRAQDQSSTTAPPSDVNGCRTPAPCHNRHNQQPHSIETTRWSGTFTFFII